MPEREPLFQKYKRQAGPLILAATGFGSIIWGAVEIYNGNPNLGNKLGQTKEEQRDTFREDQNTDSTNTSSIMVGGLIVEFAALAWAISRETKARKSQNQQPSNA